MIFQPDQYLYQFIISLYYEAPQAKKFRGPGYKLRGIKAAGEMFRNIIGYKIIMVQAPQAKIFRDVGCTNQERTGTPNRGTVSFT